MLLPGPMSLSRSLALQSLHSNCRASSLPYRPIETTHIVMTSSHTVMTSSNQRSFYDVLKSKFSSQWRPLSKLDPQPMSLRGPTQISVQNFTAVRCAVVEFIACTRCDASRLFSRFWRVNCKTTTIVIIIYLPRVSSNKKALLTPRAARDSAPWCIIIQYLQRLKMVYFS